MKSRSGFVSNSSTSSFIILLKEDAYEKNYEKADDYTKAVMNTVAGSPSEDCSDCFGISCRIIQFSEGNYDTWYEYFQYEVEFDEEIPKEYEKEYGCSSRGAFEKFREMFSEEDIEVFSIED